MAEVGPTTTIDLDSLDERVLLTCHVNGLQRAVSVGELKLIMAKRGDVVGAERKKKVNKAKSAGLHLRYLREAQARGDTPRANYHRAICYDLMGNEWTNAKLSEPPPPRGKRQRA